MSLLDQKHNNEQPSYSINFDQMKLIDYTV